MCLLRGEIRDKRDNVHSTHTYRHPLAWYPSHLVPNPPGLGNGTPALHLNPRNPRWPGARGDQGEAFAHPFAHRGAMRPQCRLCTCTRGFWLKSGRPLRAARVRLSAGTLCAAETIAQASATFQCPGARPGHRHIHCGHRGSVTRYLVCHACALDWQ